VYSDNSLVGPLATLHIIQHNGTTPHDKRYARLTEIDNFRSIARIGSAVMARTATAPDTFARSRIVSLAT
jgi:hypothetical protein